MGREAGRSLGSLAVYADAVYRRDAGALFVDEVFVLFVARMHPELDRLVLCGRVDPASGPPRNRVPDGVDFVELPYYEALDRPWAAASTTVRAIRRFWSLVDEVDTVWLFGPHPLSVVFALISKVRGKRLVLGVRQDMPAYVSMRHPGRRGLRAAALLLEGAWRLLARSSYTVVVGADLARRYRHAQAVLDISVSLVEDDDLVSPEEALAQGGPVDLRVLSVGRLDPEKNPELLADVLAKLLAHDGCWRLTVCGDGTKAVPLRRRLRTLGVEGRAELLGVVSLQELQSWYRDSDVFLHVSWTEGVPQVLLEAFAAGLPVAATDVGGVAAFAGGAALLFPPGDSEAAAGAVLRLMSDDTLRARLVHRGLEVARRHTGTAERARIVRFLAGPAGKPAQFQDESGR